MDTSSADRDLLVSVLAAQLGFLPRENAKAVLDAWQGATSRPLEGILCDFRAVEPQVLDLLGALVQKQLEHHGHDVSRCLAGFEPIDPNRSGHQHAEELPTAESPTQPGTAQRGHGSDNASTYDPATDTGEQTGVGQRYRVLRTHARGGLGEVHVAHDKELNREVALKQIQARYAHDARARSRFVLEAEVTGALEHPGIVPVYGLGRYADGRPFYTMRLIRGDSLKDALERFHRPRFDRANATTEVRLKAPVRFDPDFGSLEFRQLLRRYVDVCNAMAYAHSRGVLHRDLKPGNIMLGNYGETLVLDWGLAKVIGRHEDSVLPLEGTLGPDAAAGVAPTQMGATIGTPAYMSPEQAAGQVDQLGAASDVYSLGATLYHVLTGRAAFPVTQPLSVLESVQKGDYPRPRQVLANVPASLESVCLKAMALKVGERYATPSDLAADVERWLADEPVSAFREPWSERARRWIRRHRTWVRAAAVVVAIVLVSLTAVAVVVSHANRRLDAANAELQDAYGQVDRERRLAEENFAQARQAVDEFFTAVSEERLLNEPGMEPLRRDLLRRALDYYQRFTSQRRGDETIVPSLAEAHLRMGFIESDIGSTATALTAYSQARDLWDDLVRKEPGNREYRRDLARTLNSMGLLQRDQDGKLSEAMKTLQQAYQLRQQLAQEAPDDVTLQSDLARACTAMATTCLRTGQTSQCRTWHEKAIDIRERLVQREPTPDLRSDLAASFDNLAAVQTDTEALVTLQRAIKIQQGVVSEAPRSKFYRQVLASLHSRLGGAYFNGWGTTRRPHEALQAFRQAQSILRQLCAENPDVHDYRFNLAEVCDQMAWVLHQSRANPEFPDALKEAMRLSTESRELCEQLDRDNPNDVRTLRFLVNILNMIGLIQRDAEQPAASLQAFQESITLAQRLVRDNPGRKQLLSDLVMCYHNTMRLHEHLHDWDAAWGSCEQERGALEQLLAIDPNNVEYRFKMIDLLDTFGSLEWRRGKPDRAIPWWQQSLPVATKLAGDRAEPDNVMALAKLYFNLGTAQRASGNAAQALDAFGRAADTLTSSSSVPLPPTDALPLLAGAHAGRAKVLTRQGQLAEALAAWDRAVETASGVDRQIHELGRWATVARSGDYRGAATAASRRADQSGLDGRLYYAASMVLSAASDAAEMDNTLEPPERDQLVQQFAASAVASLDKARTSGLFHDAWQAAQLPCDPDLRSLANRSDFQGLLEQVQQDEHERR